MNNDYYGSSGFHAHDIAIIVLPVKVKISNAVLPACIEWTKQFTIPNGSLGKVTVIYCVLAGILSCMIL